AIDGQQTYLVEQLYAAMSGTFEGDTQKPTLRTFLLQCVFSAYVENSFSSPAAWILVRPLLQSTARLFADLILDIDATKDHIVSIVADTITVYFEAVYHALRLVIDHPGLLEEPPILLTLASFLETINASLPLIDFINRSSDQTEITIEYVNIFRQFTLFAASSLLD